MRIVKGNKLIEVDLLEFNNLISNFNQVCIDLGTGDGRYVFDNAQKKKDILYVGIDPASKQMEKYSKKAVRRKLSNVLFVQASIEQLPQELENCANKIFVNLPWGSLLEKIANPSNETVLKLKNLLKENGTLEILFGYSPEFEPSETNRLKLPEISKGYIEKNIISFFEKNGFVILSFGKITQKNLKDYQTSWSKKLSFGNKRNIFKLKLEKL